MGAARIYKAFTPYNDGDLDGIGYAQTADALYLVSLLYEPTKLTRTGHTNWLFATVTFGPTITPPTTVNSSATTPNTTGIVYRNYSYLVTAIDDDTGQESRASATTTVSNDLSLSGNFNTITWSALAGAERYAVYKESNGIYGFIGGTEGLSFEDRNISADLSDTPPKATNPFSGAGNYPSTAEFHQQRLMLARTANRPNAIYGSQSADIENMDVSRPAKPDDALSFALVGRKVNAVNAMVSTNDGLLALTTDSVYSIIGNGDGSAITPSAILPRRASGRGASRLRPIDIDEVTFFRPLQGSSVRALNYSFEIGGVRSNDVSIFSPHFFENDAIVSWAYQEFPYSCIWAVVQSGALLCFTWEADQGVWGWTKCTTSGFFEDVAIISEGLIDRVYVTVRRTINGVAQVFYERMALPHTDDIIEACHLDCAVTQIYDPPQADVQGLWHLEGATVSAYHDGYVTEGLVVENGMVTLPFEAHYVSVGLPYEAEIETLPLVAQTQQGSRHTDSQTINRVTVRTVDTKGVIAGMRGVDEEDWEPLAERQDDFMGTLPVLGAKDYNIPLPSTWSTAATLVLKQKQPLPMHVTALFLEPDAGEP